MEYQNVKAQIAVYKTQALMRKHWIQINPYFNKDFADDEMFETNILVLLDDLFKHTIDVFSDEFFINLGNIKYLCRGRKGERHSIEDLLPPSIEVAKAKNIINRWNPPDRRFLYLATTQTDFPFRFGFSMNEYVCCKEMRLTAGEEVTLSQFCISPLSSQKKVINLAYDDISRSDIFAYVDQYEKKLVNEIIVNVIENRVPLSNKNVQTQIEQHSKEIRKLAGILCGKLFLKELCDAIFVPLDTNEDRDSKLKDKCYKSFHIMAEYIEQRGIAGIIYPSTRMKLIKEKGTNLVLFNVDDAQPVLSSYHTLIMK
jgi:hypothetical protein